MLDRDTKGHLALGSALVDCLAVAGMTLPQAQAFFLVAMDEGRSVSEYAERAGASNSKYNSAFTADTRLRSGRI